ncbi:MAG TPA: hypothetical protein HA263_00365 [Methanoregulaceae archaeon]|nr:hypothetical protein [Methanoregulaceae archaeon]
MPPHCDTRDGPVVKAAMKALETGNLNYVLIWIPEESEGEFRGIFEKALRARKAGGEAREVADDWFFENAIRLHRAGEGAPYTGMKPAGLSEGPVVPRAEKAIETGDPGETINFILETVEDDLARRFRHVMEKKTYDVDDVAAGREFIEAFIGWVVYAHNLFMSVTGAGGHGDEHGSTDGHGGHR